MKLKLIILSCLCLAGCMGLPDKVKPVSNFQIDKYLGKWYEIARLDHSFERGLSQVTAEYSMRDDGGINVKNRGFSEEENQWSEANGKAYFVADTSEGYLKVSFFGPFYGSYAVFGPDEMNYQYAFVSGPRLSYLWLLSRTPKVPRAVMDEFVARSISLGFDIDELILVDHGQ